jgi:hypothetical protein
VVIVASEEVVALEEAVALEKNGADLAEAAAAKVLLSHLLFAYNI